MAGGASTPELAAAVGEAGGLGFLAAGYKTPGRCARRSRRSARSPRGPFGVNIFAPPGDSDRGRSRATRPGWPEARPRGRDDARPRRTPRRRLGGEARARRRRAGAGRLLRLRLPAARGGRRAARRRRGDVGHGHDAREARTAARAGADALVVQGVEAGAHRGSFDDAAPGDIGLLALLQLVRAQVDLPMIAAGGIATGAGVAAVLAAGARRRAGDGVPALARGRDVAAAPRRAGHRGADRTDAGVHGAHRPRDRQPVPARALRRRPVGLPRRPPHHGTAARRGARPQRPRPAAPLGRAGARPHPRRVGRGVRGGAVGGRASRAPRRSPALALGGWQFVANCSELPAVRPAPLGRPNPEM